MSDPQQPPAQPQAYPPPPGYPPPAAYAPPPAGYAGYPPAYAAPPRSQGATLLLFSKIVVIASYVAAGAGVLFGIMSLAIKGADGIGKFVQFLEGITFAAGFGGITLAAGLLLQARAREEIRRETGQPA